MSSNNNSGFILLSKLINILEDKTYYRVFAKSFVTSSYSGDSIKPDKDFVKEMFNLFIKKNELQIYYNGTIASPDFIETEINKRVLEKSESAEDLELAKELERKLIWENDVYIRIKDLKKLYANKCIVFPKTLLTSGDKKK